jgi:hypothetical protein
MGYEEGTLTAVFDLLSEVESMLKLPSNTIELARRNVDARVALAAVKGLVAYLEGDRLRAIDDLATAADEIGSGLGWWECKN